MSNDLASYFAFLIRLFSCVFIVYIISNLVQIVNSLLKIDMKNPANFKREIVIICFARLRRLSEWRPFLPWIYGDY